MSAKSDLESGEAVTGGEPRAAALHAIEAALMRSESLFRELIERSPEIVLVSDEGRIVYANPAMVRAAGAASAEALLGRRALDLVHPDEHEASLERLRRVVATNAAVEPREVRCVRDDGTDLWMETLIAPLTLGGRPTMVILGRDVTERRRQGDLLRAAEERFRLTFEHAPIGVAMTGLDGRWIRVNQALCSMLGYTADELLARSFQEVTHPDDLAQDLALVGELYRGERTFYEHPKRYIRKDGATIDVLLHVSLAHGEDGQPRHFIAHMIDITAQRQAERAMRESEARASTIARQVPVGIFEINLAGRYTSVNERWRQLTRCTEDEALGQPWDFILHPDDREMVTAAWVEAGQQGREFGVECRYRLADGHTAWVYSTAVAVRDDDSAVMGYLGTVLDVSERKQAQAQLLFNDRMASVGTLASGVAHEINNPLAYVTANLDLIVEEVRSLSAVLPADRVRDIEELASEGRQGAEKVRRIVRALKTFARADEERRVRLDVHSVLDLSISMVSTELRRRARVVRDYQWVPAVEADEARLGQVFINLLLNAAQALPEGMADRNTIRVVTRTNPAGRVFIEVHDSGVGIAPEHRGQIFDPFFTTRPVGRGIGLGLSICHGIVAALGGEITVASEPGQGATFVVSLPGVPVEVAPEAMPQAIAETRKRDGRILVVDDDPMVGTTLRRVLERDHEVTVVESAREALTLIGAGQRYDVILCDVMMPQMTGIELHTELGRLAADQQERMIFVTGGTFTPKARAFFDKAPNALIEKPFNLRNLRAVVREQLQLLRAGVDLDQ
ncbi:MAG: PAS domain S-box protein [Deltaproteobacteria bacterium]|nr:PAS domain S-box protein [Myxococcales bacterium]MDP3212898.1 PAS domain S-box protein [Deltaproteobacteria bacterium]